MKIHIPEKEGQINLSLRDIKKIEKGGIRIKASNWAFSKNDNFYIDFDSEEIKRLLHILEKEPR